MRRFLNGPVAEVGAWLVRLLIAVLLMVTAWAWRDLATRVGATEEAVARQAERLSAMEGRTVGIEGWLGRIDGKLDRLVERRP